jgi:hypothetical protein
MFMSRGQKKQKTYRGRRQNKTHTRCDGAVSVGAGVGVADGGVPSANGRLPSARRAAAGASDGRPPPTATRALALSASPRRAGDRAVAALLNMNAAMVEKKGCFGSFEAWEDVEWRRGWWSGGGVCLYGGAPGGERSRRCNNYF